MCFFYEFYIVILIFNCSLMSSITAFMILVFDVKNPLYSLSPRSSAISPNAPFSPLVATIHIGEIFVPSQLTTSADCGGCGANSGLMKFPIIHAFEIFEMHILLIFLIPNFNKQFQIS